MQGLLDLINANLMLSRFIWFGCGLIGFLILYKVRRSHYENHNILWWVWMIIFYGMVSPLIFLSALAAVSSDKLRSRK